MGTRADFYVGRGKDAEWLGSIAWDGYPGKPGWPRKLRKADSEEDYCHRVEKILDENGDDATRPEAGWPWPWEDSRTTDFAYAWDGDAVYISGFGRGWITFAEYKAYTKALKAWDEDETGTIPEPDDPWSDEKEAVFPNMKERQNVRLDGGSGVTIIGLRARK